MAYLSDNRSRERGLPTPTETGPNPPKLHATAVVRELTLEEKRGAAAVVVAHFGDTVLTRELLAMLVKPPRAGEPSGRHVNPAYASARGRWLDKVRKWAATELGLDLTDSVVREEIQHRYIRATGDVFVPPRVDAP